MIAGISALVLNSITPSNGLPSGSVTVWAWALLIGIICLFCVRLVPIALAISSVAALKYPGSCCASLIAALANSAALWVCPSIVCVKKSTGIML